MIYMGRVLTVYNFLLLNVMQWSANITVVVVCLAKMHHIKNT